METEHTPTPWAIRKYTNYFGFSIYSTVDPLFGCIAERWDKAPPLNRQKITSANADFIIRAVNSHDALVEALENLVSTVEKFCDWDDGCLYIYGHSATELERPLDQVRAALKLAKGD